MHAAGPELGTSTITVKHWSHRSEGRHADSLEGACLRNQMERPPAPATQLSPGVRNDQHQGSGLGVAHYSRAGRPVSLPQGLAFQQNLPPSSRSRSGFCVTHCCVLNTPLWLRAVHFLCTPMLVPALGRRGWRGASLWHQPLS